MVKRSVLYTLFMIELDLYWLSNTFETPVFLAKVGVGATNSDSRELKSLLLLSELSLVLLPDASEYEEFGS